jgi:hypothetical protein
MVPGSVQVAVTPASKWKPTEHESVPALPTETRLSVDPLQVTAASQHLKYRLKLHPLAASVRVTVTVVPMMSWVTEKV